MVFFGPQMIASSYIIEIDLYFPLFLSTFYPNLVFYILLCDPYVRQTIVVNNPLIGSMLRCLFLCSQLTTTCEYPVTFELYIPFVINVLMLFRAILKVRVKKIVNIMFATSLCCLKTVVTFPCAISCSVPHLKSICSPFFLFPESRMLILLSNGRISAY